MAIERFELEEIQSLIIKALREVSRLEKDRSKELKDLNVLDDLWITPGVVLNYQVSRHLDEADKVLTKMINAIPKTKKARKNAKAGKPTKTKI